jgi:spermidine/putrescine transport system permease protein
MTKNQMPNTKENEVGAKRRAWVASVLPGVVWEVLFLGAPFVGIVVMGFMTRGEFGGVERPFTLENFKLLAGFGPFGFEALYPVILLRTLLLALIAAVLCAGAALPMVFWISALSQGKRTVALMLLTIPVWTNLLVRTYAWQVLLGPESWLTRAAAAAGFVGAGEGLYPGTAAVLVCMVCDFLPFAALPLYASVEKMNWATVEAARDLGAGRWNVWRHGTYPQIKPGLWAGVIFVFLPALGQFVIPDLLGGAKTVLLGNVLQQQFGPSRDWPFGAAIATVTIVVLAAAVAVYSRKAKEELV